MTTKAYPDVTNISRVSIITTTEFIYTTLLIIMWTSMIWITSLISKIISTLVSKLNLGTGNTLPGFLLLKIFPNLLKYFSNRFKDIIVITGTNGKTTTTKLIVHALQKSGKIVITNNSGSNLIRGILTSLLLQTDFFGRSVSDLAVLEVDEFNLPLLLKQLTVTNIVLLNISRDQLDRYGETDIVFDRWVESFKNTDFSKVHTNLHCFENQIEFQKLRGVLGNTVPIRFFGPDKTILEGTSLKGLHNEINAGAAVSVLNVIGIPKNQIKESFKSLTHAYGRGERLSYKGSNFTLNLAKNPSSYNHNLELLINNKDYEFDSYYLILNDGIPDGRDVSWIYDINSDNLQKLLKGKLVFISGTRCLDMAIRLHYLDIDAEASHTTINHEVIINKILKSELKNICILPNYSAMLEVRKLLTGRSIL